MGMGYQSLGLLDGLASIVLKFTRLWSGKEAWTASAAGARMTKGLHICRHLHKAGWRVVLVDYDRWWMQGSRLSACCAAFHTVPDPEQNPIGEASHDQGGLGVVDCSALRFNQA